MRFLLLIRGIAEDKPGGALAPGGAAVGGDPDGGPTAGAVEAENCGCASGKGNWPWLLVALKASILRASSRPGPLPVTQTPGLAWLKRELGAALKGAE